MHIDPAMPVFSRKEVETIVSSDDGDDDGLGALVQKVSSRLRALLSRKEQFEALVKEFSGGGVMVEPRASEPDYK